MVHKSTEIVPVERLTASFLTEVLDEFYIDYKKNLDPTPRFINIDNIEFNILEEQTYFEVITDVKIHSEIDEFNHYLQIKFFKSCEFFYEEIDMYAYLLDRSRDYHDIWAVPRLGIIESYACIIYSIPDGMPLHELNNEFVDYILGRALAVAHGSNVSTMKFEDSRNMMHVILTTFPFSEKQKHTLIELFDFKYGTLEFTLGGYLPCSDFNPRELLVQLYTKDLTDLQRYSTGEIYGIFIPVAITDYKIRERLEHIAEMYALVAFAEFEKKGNLEHVKTRLETFVAGYSSILYENETLRLKNLYPEKMPLDVYIIIKTIGFITNDLLATGIEESKIDTLFAFVYHLLVQDDFGDLLLQEM